MSEQHTMAIHKMHVALTATVHAVSKALVGIDLSIPDVRHRANTMVNYIARAVDIAEQTFADPHFGLLDTPQARNDGPVALVEYNADTQSAKLFIHGVCIRSVGQQVEIEALRRVAEMVNTEAAK